MVSIETFKDFALSLPETSEQPHFEKTSFRFHKKIFATLDTEKSQACLKLSESDQNIYCSYDRSVIFPVPNKWGLQGWTFVNLKKVRKDIFKNAIKSAYNEVAMKKNKNIL